MFLGGFYRTAKRFLLYALLAVTVGRGLFGSDSQICQSWYCSSPLFDFFQPFPINPLFLQITGLFYLCFIFNYIMQIFLQRFILWSELYIIHIIPAVKKTVVKFQILSHTEYLYRTINKRLSKICNFLKSTFCLDKFFYLFKSEHGRHLHEVASDLDGNVFCIHCDSLFIYILRPWLDLRCYQFCSEHSKKEINISWKRTFSYYIAASIKYIIIGPRYQYSYFT